MAFWLARKRDGQYSDYIQRFDPRFWTIDFPRPMMGSVHTTGPDSLRVEVEFHHRNALAGMIWDSEDKWDHPLLAYDTDRDYSRTTLSFHWKSGGILPLDATHGPTLTIEGRDAEGVARSWYVRLWNYATGSPQDARIVLPFSDLADGWDIVSSPQPVHPKAIDRMFISLAPPGYDPEDANLLASRVNGWMELSAISCEGDRPLLEIGDVMVPPHGTRIATAYDDAYNQTPARLIRNIRGLGYRDEILHYVGMSHYFRLVAQADGSLEPDRSPETLCTPAQAWHAAFFAYCAEQGYDCIVSLSYELLAQHCPPDWMQRAHDGTPALTGWVPPSALLTPANDQVTAFLQEVATILASLQQENGIPVKFQIGEPWWWVNADHAPCIYDDVARAAFADNAPPVIDLQVSASGDQVAVLAAAAEALQFSVLMLRDRIRQTFGQNAEVYILLFTPTILTPNLPDMPVLNLPGLWRAPSFDRLQLEDYDWLTSGAEALRRSAYTTMQDLYDYSLFNQDYLAGFVLSPENAEEMWPLIDAGIDDAIARGIPRQFVWALPQVCRDGYVRLAPSEAPQEQDNDMQALDEVLYPLALGRDAGVSPEFSTSVTLTSSGHERRTSQWSDARLRFDVGPGIRSENELGTLIAFFRARRGAARGFLLPDPFDYSSNAMTGPPTMMDQQIGTGDGLAATFQLSKSYGRIDDPQLRPITRPRAETVVVSVDGVANAQWSLESGGRIVFVTAPATGAIVRAGFLFDVPVRFAEDRLDITGAAFAAGEAPSVPLIEIREDI